MNDVFINRYVPPPSCVSTGSAHIVSVAGRSAPSLNFNRTLTRFCSSMTPLSPSFYRILPERAESVIWCQASFSRPQARNPSSQSLVSSNRMPTCLRLHRPHAQTGIRFADEGAPVIGLSSLHSAR